MKLNVTKVISTATKATTKLVGASTKSKGGNASYNQNAGLPISPYSTVLTLWNDK